MWRFPVARVTALAMALVTTITAIGCTSPSSPLSPLQRRVEALITDQDQRGFQISEPGVADADLLHTVAAEGSLRVLAESPVVELPAQLDSGVAEAAAGALKGGHCAHRDRICRGPEFALKSKGPGSGSQGSVHLHRASSRG